MDVVYLCRPGDNDELRYSLRSLRNLPEVGQVWLFGGAPSWIHPETVKVVEVPQRTYNHRDAWQIKYANTRRNLHTACMHPEVADQFLLMNDDFYVTEKLSEIPVLNFGPRGVFDKFYLDQTRVPSRYVIAEWETMSWLEEIGIEDPISYSLHVPLPVDKEIMGEILVMLPESFGEDHHPAHIRTAYGNLAQIGGKTIKDVKVVRGNTRSVRRMNGRVIDRHQGGGLPRPFASSSDRAFINESFPIGKWIREMFPDPSPYEIS